MKRLPALARRAIIACAIGISVSLLLFIIIDYQSKLDYQTGWENVLFWPQIAGLLAALGLDPRMSAAVMISVNALIYSVIAFGFLILFGRLKNA